ncbi:unnamed protein product [Microthlaspi erraticum]|uniref:Uncharacterized protein n=1 Tax=Microthlaspi erraticum TaxID=1685480 RepID=A0A6D2K6H0_9BRAS|nr:unnamed protein product [Microthlaspi erraticum]
MRQNKTTKVLSPRDRVLKALRSFKLLYNKLDRDKEVRSGESKTAIDCNTWTILKSDGMQVNAEKMIGFGAVPGMEMSFSRKIASSISLLYELGRRGFREVAAYLLLLANVPPTVHCVSNVNGKVKGNKPREKKLVSKIASYASLKLCLFTCMYLMTKQFCPCVTRLL